MRNELKGHFKEADIKYIDPSYMIRSTPTISADRIYCKVCALCSLWASFQLAGTLCYGTVKRSQL